MGHIFISYSHKDTEYAHALAANLQNQGINVWIDERLDYGSQWPLEIQKQLDSCDAFILLMSPRSFVSEWVQSELQRAKRKLKPIFPLLLEGDEPWLSVESTQYYDVRGGRLPDARFYSALKRVVSVTAASVPLSVPQQATIPVEAKKPPAARWGLVVAGVGGTLLLLFVCIVAVVSGILRGLTSSPPASIVATASEMATQTLEVPSAPLLIASSPTPTSLPPTAIPTPTDTPLPPPGTCKDVYVYRLIKPKDKVCVSPESKAQADADNAAADSRRVKASLVNAYGQDACAYGYIWRNLFEGDTVCITSARYNEYRQENSDDSIYKAPGSTFCLQGYVWRDAYNGDTICVTPALRDQAAADNAQSDSFKAINYYGDDDCISGYVWREAFSGDKVCVQPAIRQQTQQDNNEAPLHTW